MSKIQNIGFALTRTPESSFRDKVNKKNGFFFTTNVGKGLCWIAG